MGIKSLPAFLKKYPEIFETVHLSEYAFQKVAVDTSLYICRIKAKCPENTNIWISSFIKFVSALRTNDVHPIFIFDTDYPIEKQKEKDKRRATRDKREDKICRLEDAIDKYNNEGVADQILYDYQKDRKIPVKLLRKDPDSPPDLNISAIEYHVKKARSQMFTVTEEDFKTAKELFKILDIPFYDSPCEGETMCADLCKQNKVSASMSEDTDLLAYDCPVFLTKVNPDEGTCVRIRHEKVLEAMGLTKEQFLDFAIMCGTDYNDNIPKIGPANAYKLIKSYGTIENIAKKAKIDVSILNHVRSRELFKDYSRTKIKPSYVGTPDMKKLAIFVAKKNIKVNMTNLDKAFNTTNNVEFIVEEVEEVEDVEEDNDENIEDVE